MPLLNFCSTATPGGILVGTFKGDDGHCSHRGDYTLIALQTWPGLRWTILESGIFIDMGPGTDSAVSGFSFMDLNSILRNLKAEIEGRIRGLE